MKIHLSWPWSTHLKWLVARHWRYQTYLNWLGIFLICRTLWLLGFRLRLGLLIPFDIEAFLFGFGTGLGCLVTRMVGCFAPWILRLALLLLVNLVLGILFILFFFSLYFLQLGSFQLFYLIYLRYFSTQLYPITS